MRVSERDGIWSRGGTPVEELPDPLTPELPSDGEVELEPPPPRPRRRWVAWFYVVSALVFVTLLWLIVTAAFAWYVRNLANYNVMYGSIGGVIALIVWMYLLAATALLGCEYNAERERIHRV